MASGPSDTSLLLHRVHSSSMSAYRRSWSDQAIRKYKAIKRRVKANKLFIHDAVKTRATAISYELGFSLADMGLPFPLLSGIALCSFGGALRQQSGQLSRKRPFKNKNTDKAF